MQLGSRSTGGVIKITVSTGGTGYTSAPSVQIVGGGGTGATAYAHMAGTAVDSVEVFASGSGYTASPSIAFSGGSGSGAAATATVYAGSHRPMTFFKGRYSAVYGVDGMGRGVRWDGAATAVQPIGLQKPHVGPAVSAASTNTGKFVGGIQMVNAGGGYSSIPTVTITGGTPTRQATAEAYLSDGRVAQIRVTDGGDGYEASPNVVISGGLGTGAQFGVAGIGKVQALTLAAGGTGYTSNATTSPSVVFASAQGLTRANASVTVGSNGAIEAVQLVSGGTGATTSGVTASIVGGGGTGALLDVGMAYRVDAVTVANSGSGYYAAPVLTFRAKPSDPTGWGAAATVYVNSTGNVTGATVFSGGEYAEIPDAIILDTSASATATLSSKVGGTYFCAIRYLDDTPASQGGPLASSISDLVEVDAGESAGTLEWSLSHAGLDDRVKAVELWRTTAGQAVLLYRVATIARDAAGFTGTYQDTLSDSDLVDVGRDGYGLMPVTLPSGQINARRFQVPPPEFAVACMFQDRAWYAVDTTGLRPNSLMYSEIDEPESVPDANELVVQENTTEPDRLVALVPLGSQLLLVQTSHIYKLNYVAQPVLDASVILGAYRGALNSRCWTVMSGVAFLADSHGVYAYDGEREEPISVAVDNYWRDGLVDFSKSDLFHVSSDTSTRVIRFHFCGPSDAEPVRALCYCAATKSWWAEQYAVARTATCQATVGGKMSVLAGGSNGAFYKESGASDAGTPVPYEFRTGCLTLEPKSGSRAVTVVYDPTTSDSTLALRLHYNNSPTPRPNAVASSLGTGFETLAGSTASKLNMKATRSALGEATGQAVASFAGRNDPRSSGGDRHVAVALGGSQSSDRVTVYGMAVEGVG
jgi:hypothetical protein